VLINFQRFEIRYILLLTIHKLSHMEKVEHHLLLMAIVEILVNHELDDEDSVLVEVVVVFAILFSYNYNHYNHSNFFPLLVWMHCESFGFFM